MNTWPEIAWDAAGSETAHRSSFGKGGAVSTPHETATLEAVKMLEKGWSAVDVSIAVSALLCVLLPHQCGIGGDGFWILNTADGNLLGLNGSGPSAARASRRDLIEHGYRNMPERGPFPITVPGLVDTWISLHSRLGSGSFRDLLAPAIKLADEGFLVTPYFRRSTAAALDTLENPARFVAKFFPNGRLPEVGQLYVSHRLAKTLAELSTDPRSFYEGHIAVTISESIRLAGGWLDKADLTAYTSEWVEPLVGQYRGLDIATMPPNSQGLTLLIALGIVDRLTIDRPTNVDMIAAVRTAFGIRNEQITDPNNMVIAPSALISPAFLDSLANSMGNESAVRSLRKNASRSLDGDTAHFVVIDRRGTAVSGIQSNWRHFGSTVIAGDTGIVLQNRGHMFSLEDNHANVLHPRKRTLHTLMPSLILRDGTPIGAIGAMGADGQPQTQLQLLSLLVDGGVDPADALAAPRWFDYGDSRETVCENRTLEEDLDAMRDAGIRVVESKAYDGLMGQGQIVLCDLENSLFVAAADPRSDGLALAIQ